MCTYNPGPFFAEQLESIASQSLKPSSLWISDDSEPSVALPLELNHVQVDVKARVLRGPRRGFAANFLSVVCHPQVDGDFFAFSDQDDIWVPDKLRVAVDELGRVPADTPAVYCGRTLLVTEDNEEIGQSPRFCRRPSFANALVQSIAGGNTMVLNRAARELVIKAGQQEIVSHDWWVYLLVSGAGGVVIYDDKPTIRYRQHDTNLVGGHTSFASHLARVRQLLLHDRFKNWNEMNMRALGEVQHMLTDSHRQTLKDFIAARSGGVLHRFRYLKKSGVYRQTPMGNLGLLIATLTGKI